MTTAPKFTKPFDLEHAKAGAPYCCRDGREATVLKWDGRHPVYPVNGVSGPDDYMACWTAGGQYHTEQRSSPNDLAMLPLGMIDGKPVFVGDALIDPSGAVFVPGPTNSGHLSGCSWPAPAKVYPVSTCPGDLLAIAYNTSDFFSGSIRAVANLALRHAIDAGQVIMKSDADEVISEMGKSVAAELAGRAARDMAIAEAVRNACRNNLPGDTFIKVTAVYGRISNVSLEGVIAGVKS